MLKEENKAWYLLHGINEDVINIIQEQMFGKYAVSRKDSQTAKKALNKSIKHFSGDAGVVDILKATLRIF